MAVKKHKKTPLVWSEELGRKTNAKTARAIRENKARKERK